LNGDSIPLLQLFWSFSSLVTLLQQIMSCSRILSICSGCVVKNVARFLSESEILALTRVSTSAASCNTAVRKYSAGPHNLLEKSYKRGKAPEEL